MILSAFKSIFELLYVPVCVGCNEQVIQRPSIFCSVCSGKLPYTNMECEVNNEFEKHFTGRAHIEAGTALFYFSKGGVIQHAIHALKYENLPQTGFCFGQMLGIKLMKNPIYRTCDAVMGIPLHKRKKHKRGYNQAEFIAAGVSDVMKIGNMSDQIIRVRQTNSQTRKSRLQRMVNVNGGFSVKNEERIAGKHILLVDDVLTSGATLDFCGQAILKATNCKLSMATVAMGSIV